MSSTAPPTPPSDGSKGAAEESLASAGVSLLRTFRSIVGDILGLVALEARLAGLSIAAMLGLGVAAALLFITAWLLFVAGIAFSLVDLGLGWGLALLITALLNIALGVILIRLIFVFSRNLLFKATRRQIAPHAREGE
ncbi:MAG: hypothetical protein HYX62_02615 [Gammaproteobacteria bacterium]|nr:hypothetical protein [Gammaproteobacteria bacterium]